MAQRAPVPGFPSIRQRGDKLDPKEVERFAREVQEWAYRMIDYTNTIDGGSA